MKSWPTLELNYVVSGVRHRGTTLMYLATLGGVVDSAVGRGEGRRVAGVVGHLVQGGGARLPGACAGFGTIQAVCTWLHRWVRCEHSG